LDFISYSECDDCYRCENCYSEHYCNCNSCNPELNKSLSDHARDLRNNGYSAILDYHPKIDLEFYANDCDLSSNPYYGLELEFEANSDKRQVRSILDDACGIVGKLLVDHAFITRDGSLRDGAEIVFCPHKKNALKELNLYKLLKELKKCDVTIHDTERCGFHIHITKIAWFKEGKTKYSILNRDLLLIDNASIFQHVFNKFEPFIKLFSKRKQHQIDSYCSFENGNYERYLAVNLTNPRTVEIRIWNGTLNFERLRANFLFTECFLDFCREHSSYFLIKSSYGKLLESFNYYLSINKSRYSHLVKFLNAEYGQFFNIK